MPARDTYHNQVKQALINDGWTITHDPLRLEVGTKDVYIDLGAERLIAAEKAERKIAVEVKSFISKSDVQDLKEAAGQYVIYDGVLEELEPERKLYLAVRQDVYQDLFVEPLGQIAMRKGGMRLVVFDSEKEVILRWIP